MTEFLITWLPLVFILVVVAFGAVWSTRSYRRHADRVESVNAEHLVVNHEILAELRAIKELLKDRN